jgi:cytochrome c biogenesis protein CcmG, thiol:disulfide interchange protein DsbE
VIRRPRRSSWCPPCAQETPLLAAAATRYAGRVAFLGLDVNDTDASAHRFLAAHPLPYPIYTDPHGTTAAALARFVGLPTTLFLDATGTLVAVHMGQYPDAAALQADIQRHALQGAG